MTKKDFKEAMLRGLGRCVIAVRKEPEKYRDLVMWACKRNFAYDAQSEGTRSWYTYTMANAYPDKETFINTAAEALKKYRPNGSWDLLHLSEILMFFAMDGDESARKALEEKYQEVLMGMFARKRRPNRVFHELSDLEQLGLVLAVDSKSFLRIAGDLGRLYREKNYMRDGDFAWFFSSKGGQFRKTMEAAVQKDENIACFFQRESADIAAREELWEQRKKNFPDDLKGVRLSRWLANKADQETVEQYVLAYRKQVQPVMRAEALMAFSCCPYPDDPYSIIEDIQSNYEELQNAAWRALENIRHPAVREFALNNVDNGIRTPENFALLATNYMPEDGKLMEELLREMISQKDWDGVHAAGMDIYRAFHDGSGIPHPKHLLPLLYEYNPCSFCRESALVYMSKHRMLTKEMLEECQFDSNNDIRKMAARRLK
ncbi:MAG: hypothetical protein J6Q53_09280 [Oscillospiraceae bacterium]|nr:hypothetical protein [Oscillospiraceae bacterium]